MIRFGCSGCGNQLQVPLEWAGKTVRCAGCNQPVQVPAVAARAPAAAPPGAEVAASLSAPGLPVHGFTLNCDTNPPPGTSAGQERYDFLAPPQGPDELGRLGRYRILRVLGRGGMGVVFHAEDTVLRRSVALKTMLPALAASAADRQRFLREAQATAAIEHDHIVAIYDIGEERGIPFLAMPLLQGETLADRLQRPPRLPMAEVVRLGREIAEGLAAAHARGLIHRDIKPGNVWLEGSRGRVKVLDFGLARSTDDPGHLTKTGYVLGTPAYMAPEQAAGAQVDHRCDLFSLGCLLYQMCTGEMPFQGSNLVSLVVAVATQQPRPVEELNPAVPPALGDLVKRLLAKRREERPASAQEVAQTLQAIAGGLTQPPPPALPPTLRERPARLPLSSSPSSGPLARPRVGRVLVGGGMLLLLGIGVFALGHFLGENGPDQDPKPARRPPLTENEEPADNKAQKSDRGSKPDKAGGGKQPAPVNPRKTDKVGDGKKSAPVNPRPAKRAGAVVTNALGMKFAWCPPGIFLMGSPKTEKGRSKEETQHRVTLTRGFYMGVHGVTQKQWQAVMGNNPSKFKGDDLPMDSVSWDDCQTFCRKLGQQDGKRYRLPTEAEWEYACRAGTTTVYSFGNDWNQLGRYAWYKDNSESKTHPVGKLTPNAWGLYDMHGNVWQWCQDWCAEYDKKDIEYHQYSNKGDTRVLRGGSSLDEERHCRAASRLRLAPSGRYHFVGCRAVLCLD